MFGKRFAENNQTPLPHSQLGNEMSIPNVALKYEPYEPYSLEGVAGPSSKTGTAMESEIKYSYSLAHHKIGHGNELNPIPQHDLMNHNHTYALPHLSNNGTSGRPQMRDKKVNKKSEDEHLTRDEKRARSMQIPISVQDIINLPMDEFNSEVTKYDLSKYKKKKKKNQKKKKKP
jgi:nuclear factor erythroid 2